MLKHIEKYSASLLALPFMVTIGLFFILPLLLVVIVSFWDYTSYSIVPDFIFTNYEDIFYGCIDNLPQLCTAFSTYLSTIKFVIITWFITLIVGFLIALFWLFAFNLLHYKLHFFYSAQFLSGHQTLLE